MSTGAFVRTLLLCSCWAAVACSPTLQAGREAFEQGRLRDAERVLVELAGKDPQAQALLERVRGDKLALVQTWLTQAKELAATSAGQVRALQLYRAAFAFLSEDDAAFDSTQRAVVALEDKNKQHAAELGSLLRWVQTKAVLKECTFADLDAPLNRMILLRDELGDVGWVSRSVLARLLELAEACFSAGEYVSAAKITDVADRSRLPLELLSVDDEARRDLSKLRTPTQPQEVVAVKTENDQDKQPHSARREPKPTPPRPPDPLEIPRRLFAAGQVHAALLSLDRCAKEAIADELSARIAAVSKEWQPERAKLIAQYLATAEKALSDEAPETALTAYLRILELEPQHQVANDRTRKLQTLRKLRGTN